MNRTAILVALTALSFTAAACQNQNPPSPDSHGGSGAYDNMNTGSGTAHGGTTTGNLGGQDGSAGGGGNVGSR